MPVLKSSRFLPAWDIQYKEASPMLPPSHKHGAACKVFTKLRNGNLRLHASAVEIFQPSESSNCATSWKIWKGSFLGMTWIAFKKIHHTTYPDHSWSFLAQFVQKDSFNAAQGSLLKASKIPFFSYRSIFSGPLKCAEKMSQPQPQHANHLGDWKHLGERVTLLGQYLQLEGRKSIKMLAWSFAIHPWKLTCPQKRD